jgi:hypothetical protein
MAFAGVEPTVLPPLPAPADNAAMELEPTKADPPKRKGRWFQFSLRTLLIFTLICAIACAWLARRIEQKRRERAAVDAILQLKGSVVLYDYELNDSGDIVGGEMPQPAWLRRFFGDDCFRSVALVHFSYEDVTRSHLDYITPLADLRYLYDHEAHAKDSDLEKLENLQELQLLDLGGTSITDAGLQHLKGLAQLQTLELSNTKVTDAGVKVLQKALPNCNIQH